MWLIHLVWKEGIAEHIARHHVDPFEVDEVSFSDGRRMFKVGRNKDGSYRYRMCGTTDEGRYLLAYLDHYVGTKYEVVTAREMNEDEKRWYRVHL